MLVHRSLIQLSVHQFPDNHLRVTVFLKAEIAAVGEAAFYRGAGQYIARNVLMHHDAAMALRAHRENAVAKRAAALNFPPGGEPGFHHFFCVQYILDLCDSLRRALHQIFLGAEQVAVVMSPVIVAVEASPGDEIIGDMLTDAKDKFGVPHMNGVRNDISGIDSLTHISVPPFLCRFCSFRPAEWR